ncbi:MAG: MBL fold metallo-hydrolase [Candidatus Thorarchaeota archaeon]|jgi:glyoxylase-like metal-dependent hydrolase (beta-lactamase superfamily II)
MLQKNSRTGKIMASSEIVSGIHVVQGKFAGEFGFIASYLVVDDDEVLVIDPGTAGDPGKGVYEAVDILGLSAKRDIIGIVCTHGHPDHVGGAARLHKNTGAPVMIHKDDAMLLEEPQLFIKERLRMDFAARVSMKFESGPLRVNYKGITPTRLLSHGDIIRVGDISLTTIHTRGHSAGHCVFYHENKKALFTGDEINNFPNDPRKFYVDLSGSLTAKRAAADQLEKLSVDFLLPAHDAAHILGDVRLQFEEVRDGVIQFQDAVLGHISARTDADTEQLVYDIQHSRSIPYPTALDTLLPTTIQVCLEDLKKAGLVKQDDNEVWKLA